MAGAELGDHTQFIAHDVASAIQLDYPRAHNALTKIFVRRTD